MKSVSSLYALTLWALFPLALHAEGEEGETIEQPATQEKNFEKELLHAMKRVMAQVSSLEGEMTLLKEEGNAEVKENVAQLGSQIKDLESHLMALEQLQLKEHKLSLDTLNSHMENAEKLLSQLETQLKSKAHTASVDNLIAEVNQVQQNVTNLQTESKKRVSLSPRCVQGDVGIFLTADLLYWKLQEGGNTYAYTYDSNPVSVASEHFVEGKAAKTDFDWNFGYRVGVGYRSTYDAWDIYLNYTSFSTHAHGKKEESITSSKTLYPLLQYQELEFMEVSKAKARWHVRFQNLDFDFGRDYYVSCHLAFHPSFGVKGAVIDQKMHVAYSGFDLGSSPYKIHNKNDFWGIGPKAGLSSRWFLGEAFNVFGGLYGALLWGHFDVNNRHFRAPSNLPEEQVFDIKDDFDRAVPTAQFLLGLGWDTLFDHDKFHIGLNISFESQYWWRQNQMTNTPASQNSVSEDLSLYGVTGSITLDF